MSEVVSVVLGDMGGKARRWIAEGRYDSMSDLICEGLREIEKREAEFDEMLKIKIQEALDDPRPHIPLEEALARIKATPIR